MRRLFWIALGASAGIVVARQLRDAARSLTPGSVAGNLSGTLREFWDDVKDGMAEREAELREAFGFDSPAGGGTGSAAAPDSPSAH